MDRLSKTVETMIRLWVMQEEKKRWEYDYVQPQLINFPVAIPFQDFFRRQERRGTKKLSW